MKKRSESLICIFLILLVLTMPISLAQDLTNPNIKTGVEEIKKPTAPVINYDDPATYNQEGFDWNKVPDDKVDKIPAEKINNLPLIKLNSAITSGKLTQKQVKKLSVKTLSTIGPEQISKLLESKDLDISQIEKIPSSQLKFGDNLDKIGDLSKLQNPSNVLDAIKSKHGILATIEFGNPAPKGLKYENGKLINPKFSSAGINLDSLAKLKNLVLISAVSESGEGGEVNGFVLIGKSGNFQVINSRAPDLFDLDFSSGKVEVATGNSRGELKEGDIQAYIDPKTGDVTFLATEGTSFIFNDVLIRAQGTDNSEGQTKIHFENGKLIVSGSAKISSDFASGAIHGKDGNFQVIWNANNEISQIKVSKGKFTIRSNKDIVKVSAEGFATIDLSPEKINKLTLSWRSSFRRFNFKTDNFGVQYRNDESFPKSVELIDSPTGRAVEIYKRENQKNLLRIDLKRLKSLKDNPVGINIFLSDVADALKEVNEQLKNDNLEGVQRLALEERKKNLNAYSKTNIPELIDEVELQLSNINEDLRRWNEEKGDKKRTNFIGRDDSEFLTGKWTLTSVDSNDARNFKLLNDHSTYAFIPGSDLTKSKGVVLFDSYLDDFKGNIASGSLDYEYQGRNRKLAFRVDSNGDENNLFLASKNVLDLNDLSDLSNLNLNIRLVYGGGQLDANLDSLVAIQKATGAVSSTFMIRSGKGVSAELIKKSVEKFKISRAQIKGRTDITKLAIDKKIDLLKTQVEDLTKKFQNKELTRKEYSEQYNSLTRTYDDLLVQRREIDKLAKKTDYTFEETIFEKSNSENKELFSSKLKSDFQQLLISATITKGLDSDLVQALSELTLASDLNSKGQLIEAESIYQTLRTSDKSEIKNIALDKLASLKSEQNNFESAISLRKELFQNDVSDVNNAMALLQLQKGASLIQTHTILSEDLKKKISDIDSEILKETDKDKLKNLQARKEGLNSVLNQANGRFLERILDDSNSLKDLDISKTNIANIRKKINDAVKEFQTSDLNIDVSDINSAVQEVFLSKISSAIKSEKDLVRKKELIDLLLIQPSKKNDENLYKLRAEVLTKQKKNAEAAKDLEQAELAVIRKLQNADFDIKKAGYNRFDYNELIKDLSLQKASAYYNDASEFDNSISEEESEIFKLKQKIVNAKRKGKSTRGLETDLEFANNRLNYNLELKTKQNKRIKRAFEDAADSAEFTLAIDAFNFDAQKIVGSSYLGVGNTKQAVESYKQFVELSPENKLAKDKYAQALMAHAENKEFSSGVNSDDKTQIYKTAYVQFTEAGNLDSASLAAIRSGDKKIIEDIRQKSYELESPGSSANDKILAAKIQTKFSTEERTKALIKLENLANSQDKKTSELASQVLIQTRAEIRKKTKDARKAVEQEENDKKIIEDLARLNKLDKEEIKHIREEQAKFSRDPNKRVGFWATVGGALGDASDYVLDVGEKLSDKERAEQLKFYDKRLKTLNEQIASRQQKSRILASQFGDSVTRLHVQKTLGLISSKQFGEELAKIPEIERDNPKLTEYQNEITKDSLAEYKRELRKKKAEIVEYKEEQEDAGFLASISNDILKILPEGFAYLDRRIKSSEQKINVLENQLYAAEQLEKLLDKGFTIKDLNRISNQGVLVDREINRGGKTNIQSYKLNGVQAIITEYKTRTGTKTSDTNLLETFQGVSEFLNTIDGEKTAKLSRGEFDDNSEFNYLLTKAKTARLNFDSVAEDELLRSAMNLKVDLSKWSKEELEDYQKQQTTLQARIADLNEAKVSKLGLSKVQTKKYGDIIEEVAFDPMNLLTFVGPVVKIAGKTLEFSKLAFSSTRAATRAVKLGTRTMSLLEKEITIAKNLEKTYELARAELKVAQGLDDLARLSKAKKALSAIETAEEFKKFGGIKELSKSIAKAEKALVEERKLLEARKFALSKSGLKTACVTGFCASVEISEKASQSLIEFDKTIVQLNKELELAKSTGKSAEEISKIKRAIESAKLSRSKSVESITKVQEATSKIANFEAKLAEELAILKKADRSMSVIDRGLDATRQGIGKLKTAITGKSNLIDDANLAVREAKEAYKTAKSVDKFESAKKLNDAIKNLKIAKSASPNLLNRATRPFTRAGSKVLTILNSGRNSANALRAETKLNNAIDSLELATKQYNALKQSGNSKQVKQALLAAKNAISDASDLVNAQKQVLEVFTKQEFGLFSLGNFKKLDGNSLEKLAIAQNRVLEIESANSVSKAKVLEELSKIKKGTKGIQFGEIQKIKSELESSIPSDILSSVQESLKPKFVRPKTQINVDLSSINSKIDDLESKLKILDEDLEFKTDNAFDAALNIQKVEDELNLAKTNKIKLEQELEFVDSLNPDLADEVFTFKEPSDLSPDLNPDLADEVFTFKEPSDLSPDLNPDLADEVFTFKDTLNPAEINDLTPTLDIADELLAAKKADVSELSSDARFFADKHVEAENLRFAKTDEAKAIESVKFAESDLVKVNDEILKLNSKRDDIVNELFALEDAISPNDELKKNLLSGELEVLDESISKASTKRQEFLKQLGRENELISESNVFDLQVPRSVEDLETDLVLFNDELIRLKDNKRLLEPRLDELEIKLNKLNDEFLDGAYFDSDKLAQQEKLTAEFNKLNSELKQVDANIDVSTSAREKLLNQLGREDQALSESNVLGVEVPKGLDAIETEISVLRTKDLQSSSEVSKFKKLSAKRDAIYSELIDEASIKFKANPTIDNLRTLEDLELNFARVKQKTPQNIFGVSILPEGVSKDEFFKSEFRNYFYKKLYPKGVENAKPESLERFASEVYKNALNKRVKENPRFLDKFIERMDPEILNSMAPETLANLDPILAKQVREKFMTEFSEKLPEGYQFAIRDQTNLIKREAQANFLNSGRTLSTNYDAQELLDVLKLEGNPSVEEISKINSRLLELESSNNPKITKLRELNDRISETAGLRNNGIDEVSNFKKLVDEKNSLLGEVDLFEDIGASVDKEFAEYVRLNEQITDFSKVKSDLAKSLKSRTLPKELEYEAHARAILSDDVSKARLRIDEVLKQDLVDKRKLLVKNNELTKNLPSGRLDEISEAGGLTKDALTDSQKIKFDNAMSRAEADLKSRIESLDVLADTVPADSNRASFLAENKKSIQKLKANNEQRISEIKNLGPCQGRGSIASGIKASGLITAYASLIRSNCVVRPPITFTKPKPKFEPVDTFKKLKEEFTDLQREHNTLNYQLDIFRENSRLGIKGAITPEYAERLAKRLERVKQEGMDLLAKKSALKNQLNSQLNNPLTDSISSQARIKIYGRQNFRNVLLDEPVEDLGSFAVRGNIMPDDLRRVPSSVSAPSNIPRPREIPVPLQPPREVPISLKTPPSPVKPELIQSVNPESIVKAPKFKQAGEIKTFKLDPDLDDIAKIDSELDSAMLLRKIYKREAGPKRSLNRLSEIEKEAFRNKNNALIELEFKRLKAERPVPSINLLKKEYLESKQFKLGDKLPSDELLADNYFKNLEGEATVNVWKKEVGVKEVSTLLEENAKTLDRLRLERENTLTHLSLSEGRLQSIDTSIESINPIKESIVKGALDEKRVARRKFIDLIQNKIDDRGTVFTKEDWSELKRSFDIGESTSLNRLAEQLDYNSYYSPEGIDVAFGGLDKLEDVTIRPLQKELNALLESTQKKRFELNDAILEWDKKIEKLRGELDSKFPNWRTNDPIDAQSKLADLDFLNNARKFQIDELTKFNSPIKDLEAQLKNSKVAVDKKKQLLADSFGISTGELDIIRGKKSSTVARKLTEGRAEDLAKLKSNNFGKFVDKMSELRGQAVQKFTDDLARSTLTTFEKKRTTQLLNRFSKIEGVPTAKQLEQAQDSAKRYLAVLNEELLSATGQKKIELIAELDQIKPFSLMPESYLANQDTFSSIARYDALNKDLVRLNNKIRLDEGKQFDNFLNFGSDKLFTEKNRVEQIEHQLSLLNKEDDWVRAESKLWLAQRDQLNRKINTRINRLKKDNGFFGRIKETFSSSKDLELQKLELQRLELLEYQIPKMNRRLAELKRESFNFIKEFEQKSLKHEKLVKQLRSEGNLELKNLVLPGESVSPEIQRIQSNINRIRQQNPSELAKDLEKLKEKYPSLCNLKNVVAITNNAIVGFASFDRCTKRRVHISEAPSIRDLERLRLEGKEIDFKINKDNFLIDFGDDVIIESAGNEVLNSVDNILTSPADNIITNPVDKTLASPVKDLVKTADDEFVILTEPVENIDGLLGSRELSDDGSLLWKNPASAPDKVKRDEVFDLIESEYGQFSDARNNLEKLTDEVPEDLIPYLKNPSVENYYELDRVEDELAKLVDMSVEEVLSQEGIELSGRASPREFLERANVRSDLTVDEILDWDSRRFDLINSGEESIVDLRKIEENLRFVKAQLRDLRHKQKAFPNGAMESFKFFKTEKKLLKKVSELKQNRDNFLFFDGNSKLQEYISLTKKLKSVGGRDGSYANIVKYLDLQTKRKALLKDPSEILKFSKDLLESRAKRYSDFSDSAKKFSNELSERILKRDKLKSVIRRADEDIEKLKFKKLDWESRFKAEYLPESQRKNLDVAINVISRQIDEATEKLTVLNQEFDSFVQTQGKIKTALPDGYTKTLLDESLDEALKIRGVAESKIKTITADQVRSALKGKLKSKLNSRGIILEDLDINKLTLDELRDLFNRPIVIKDASPELLMFDEVSAIVTNIQIEKNKLRKVLSDSDFDFDSLGEISELLESGEDIEIIKDRIVELRELKKLERESLADNVLFDLSVDAEDFPLSDLPSSFSELPSSSLPSQASPAPLSPSISPRSTDKFDTLGGISVDDFSDNVIDDGINNIGDNFIEAVPLPKSTKPSSLKLNPVQESNLKKLNLDLDDINREIELLNEEKLHFSFSGDSDEVNTIQRKLNNIFNLKEKKQFEIRKLESQSLASRNSLDTAISRVNNKLDSELNQLSVEENLLPADSNRASILNQRRKETQELKISRTDELEEIKNLADCDILKGVSVSGAITGLANLDPSACKVFHSKTLKTPPNLNSADQASVTSDEFFVKNLEFSKSVLQKKLIKLDGQIESAIFSKTALPGGNIKAAISADKLEKEIQAINTQLKFRKAKLGILKSSKSSQLKKQELETLQKLSGDLELLKIQRKNLQDESFRLARSETKPVFDAQLSKIDSQISTRENRLNELARSFDLQMGDNLKATNQLSLHEFDDLFNKNSAKLLSDEIQNSEFWKRGEFSRLVSKKDKLIKTAKLKYARGELSSDDVVKLQNWVTKYRARLRDEIDNLPPYFKDLRNQLEGEYESLEIGIRNPNILLDDPNLNKIIPLPGKEELRNAKLLEEEARRKAKAFNQLEPFNPNVESDKITPELLLIKNLKTKDDLLLKINEQKAEFELSLLQGGEDAKTAIELDELRVRTIKEYLDTLNARVKLLSDQNGANNLLEGGIRSRAELFAAAKTDEKISEEIAKLEVDISKWTVELNQLTPNK